MAGIGAAGRGGLDSPNSGGIGGTMSTQGGTSGSRSGGQGGGLATGGNRMTGGNKAGQGGSVSTGGRASTGGTTGTNNETPPPIQTGCNGYATRFWDCCKPHCGWPGNVSNGVKPVNSCSASNASIDVNAQSSCSGGGSHMCYGLTPWAVNTNLAYGFAATSSGDVCGKCYQLQFTGASHNGGNDPGSKALQGKTMIVQALNVGFDVGGGQFDIAIPGGGVGAFNACSAQWGVSNGELGAQYGGFLAVCRQQGGNNHDAVKSCVLQKCTSVFQSRGLNDLAAGCRWSVEWLQAADNPALKYKEVACPQPISARSGMVRNGVDNRCGN
jgi:Glycosyl hydrolase family 45